MMTFRKLILVLALTVGAGACSGSILGPHNPDPGSEHNPDPGLHNPDPGAHNPDPGAHNPDPGA